ncbi:MAG: PAS domain-containing protein, partial [Mariprofundaceae bacterium]
TPDFRRGYPIWLGWAVFVSLGLFTLLVAALVEYELAMRDASAQLADFRRRRLVAGRAMLNAIGIPITLIRKDFTYERANLAFARLHGLPDAAAVEGRKVEELWGEEVFAREIRPALETAFGGEAIARTFTHTIGGAFRHFRTVMYPFERDGKREGAVVVTRDVTEEVRAAGEREARLRREAREKHLRELGLLAGGIAHDINNMLAVIVGEAEIMRFDAEANAALLPHLEQVIQTSERAGRLCRQLLAYAGKGNRVPRCQNAQVLLDELRPMLTLAAGKRVELVMDIDPRTPRFFADQSQIEQLLLNLVINASEAIGELPGGRIRVRCGPERPDLDEWQAQGNGSPPPLAVRFTVEDNGCGMDEETRKRIFEPFYTTKDHGSGMGLAAVQGI